MFLQEPFFLIKRRVNVYLRHICVILKSINIRLMFSPLLSLYVLVWFRLEFSISPPDEGVFRLENRMKQ